MLRVPSFFGQLGRPQASGKYLSLRPQHPAKPEYISPDGAFRSYLPLTCGNFSRVAEPDADPCVLLRLNRYSMPVTRSRTYLDIGLEDSNNTTGFLFGDEDSTTEARAAATNNADSFPALLQQQAFRSMVSLFSNCLDKRPGDLNTRFTFFGTESSSWTLASQLSL